LHQERALNLFVLSHFLRKIGIHQQNSGVPEFCHYYQWRKSETSDLIINGASRKHPTCGGRAPGLRSGNALPQEALVLDAPLYFGLAHRVGQSARAPARKGCCPALLGIGMGIVLVVGRRGHGRTDNEHQNDQSQL
jgi:hypothetical protein